jgi:hypothetical protein
MRHLVEAMKEAGANFVLPFRFRNTTGKRTTHFLVFVTKHQKGYELMKEIMAEESSHNDQGVPSLEYAPSLKRVRYLFETAMDDLEDKLTVAFAGRSLTMEQIYHEHNVDTPYTKNNYKTALANLLQAKRITTDRAPRAGSFADNIVVTFPKKPIARK